MKREKHDFFNAPPRGFIRTQKGWLQAEITPQKRQLDKVKTENQELKSRLEQLETLVQDLVTAKSED